MDINLEKIELVKDRTGSTYAEAKEALEKADGSVVDAIIDIEEKMNKEFDAVDGGSLNGPVGSGDLIIAAKRMLHGKEQNR